MLRSPFAEGGRSTASFFLTTGYLESLAKKVASSIEKFEGIKRPRGDGGRQKAWAYTRLSTI
jgi:hypothetical protein